LVAEAHAPSVGWEKAMAEKGTLQDFEVLMFSLRHEICLSYGICPFEGAFNGSDQTFLEASADLSDEMFFCTCSYIGHGRALEIEDPAEQKFALERLKRANEFVCVLMGKNGVICNA
jgi:hypothetical protein